MRPWWWWCEKEIESWSFTLPGWPYLDRLLTWHTTNPLNFNNHCHRELLIAFQIKTNPTSEDTFVLHSPLCDVFLLSILRALHHVLRPYLHPDSIFHYWTGKLVSRIYLKRFTYWLVCDRTKRCRSWCLQSFSSSFEPPSPARSGFAPNNAYKILGLE